MASDNQTTTREVPEPTTYTMPKRNYAANDAARKCRYELYRHHEAMRKTIDAMETDEQMKGELRNLFAVALRMALLANDGNLCSRELQTW